MDPKLAQFYARMSGVVITKVLLMALCWWLGTKLDQYFGTNPLCQVLLITLAGALGIWWLVKIIDKR